jgi:spore coat protein CotH
MKVIFSVILGFYLIISLVISTLITKGSFIGGGSILRNEKETELTIKVNGITAKEGLESVTFFIWQRKLDGLTILLESPSGIRSELTRSNGKFGSWYKHTVLTDHCDSLIYAAKHPFKRTYRPNQFLGWLNEGEKNGKWKLIIKNKHPFARKGVIFYWSLKFGDNPCKIKTIESSSLPLLVINTNSKRQISYEKNTKGELYILSGKQLNTISDTAVTKPMNVKLKERGFSSRQLPKKSYSLDLEESSDSIFYKLLNLPPGHDWILNANCMEKSMIRNQLTYQLYKQSGYDISEGKSVEVILNGAYIGIYTLQDKIKPSPSKLNDTYSNPNGFMLKLDAVEDKKPGFYSDINGWESRKKPFMQFVYPSYKNLSEEKRKYIIKKYKTFDNTLSNINASDSLQLLIDIRSFADYIIFEELSKNNDGYNLSVNFYTDKQNRIAIGPIWDFDRAWGNSNSCFTRETEGWQIILYHKHDYHPAPRWWKNLLLNEQFKEVLKHRWTELSSTVLSENNIMQLIDSLSAPIVPLQSRNFKTWPVWGIIRSNFYTNSGIKDYDDEIKDLKQWIAKRRNWMDAQFKRTGGPVFVPEI